MVKKVSLLIIILTSLSYAKAQISLLDTVKSDIKVKNYFSYLDKIIKKYNDTLSYQINEYTLVNANPWIIDSLAAMDYYTTKLSGKPVMNQKEEVILRKNKILNIPTEIQNQSILENLANNRIYINIPEYKLQIYNGDLLILDAPIRVGRNESKYLQSIDRYTDLRTMSGKGMVHGTERNPTWINPADNHKYTETNRDDKIKTKMPQTPSIQLQIGKKITGQLIHATTNPASLGKPYSNGCIGTNEMDIWYIIKRYL
jgi:L,D-transpeptidase ErfK/SrfK